MKKQMDKTKKKEKQMNKEKVKLNALWFIIWFVGMPFYTIGSIFEYTCLLLKSAFEQICNWPQIVEKALDEIDVRIDDIEKELVHYEDKLKGKVVYMPCDSVDLFGKGLPSNFWVYFHKNFERLGLKKIVATYFNEGGRSYKIEYSGGCDNDVLDYVKVVMDGDGDFRSEEVVSIMKKSDVVVTNPPFSLFREFFNQLVQLQKRFLILGSPNAVSYKDIFPLIKQEKVWCGVVFNKSTTFVLADGTTKDVQINWYTNLDHNKRWEDVVLYKKYNEEDYPKYDNYDAINVNKSKDVPMDYDGVMGVPITFLNKCNPKRFEIVGIMSRDKVDVFNKGYPKIDGKKKYARLLIKKL